MNLSVETDSVAHPYRNSMAARFVAVTRGEGRSERVVEEVDLIRDPPEVEGAPARSGRVRHVVSERNEEDSRSEGEVSGGTRTVPEPESPEVLALHEREEIVVAQVGAQPVAIARIGLAEEYRVEFRTQVQQVDVWRRSYAVGSAAHREVRVSGGNAKLEPLVGR